ncbi:hypothetical protein G4L39_11630 [Limisphaera ngatamarikiensis]|uniref:Uncharacterized protein n=1 Tax=Limisphaera ngatamarikiensis TaxID=1324935 RepID=A0A6M1RJX5_9BACT|nr:hypothetical protein [Limisphaera ngatamarikiensis]NGO40036.1 hypothetical protein [Limisphaera ngatamarikiensis]
MDWLKKHYEKLILGVVLVVAAVAVAAVPLLISQTRAQLEEQRNNIVRRPIRPLPPLDLSPMEAVVQRLETPLHTDFGRPHFLFNPVQWQRTPDGNLIKLARGTETGPDAAVVTEIRPLHLILTFDSVGPVLDGQPSGYLIGVENEAAPTPAARRKRQTFVRLNEKKEDLFTLREVQGPPDNPTGLVLELSDTGQRVVISREQPFRRVEGYVADIRYDPEKRVFSGRRVGDRITLAGEDYNVVAITDEEVVVSHRLTGKKFTIRMRTEG